MCVCHMFMKVLTYLLTYLLAMNCMKKTPEMFLSYLLQKTPADWPDSDKISCVLSRIYLPQSDVLPDLALPEFIIYVTILHVVLCQIVIPFLVVTCTFNAVHAAVIELLD